MRLFVARTKGRNFPDGAWKKSKLTSTRPRLSVITSSKHHGMSVMAACSHAAFFPQMVQDPSLLKSYQSVLYWMASGGNTVFLQDANSLILPTDSLVAILHHIRKSFPEVERVTSYARALTLAGKTLERFRSAQGGGTQSPARGHGIGIGQNSQAHQQRWHRGAPYRRWQTGRRSRESH